MKKFLKWFIGIIIVAAIAFGVCKYMEWGYCDNTCDTTVTEEVITDEDVATEIAEDAVEIDTMIVDTIDEVTDTIQNTTVEIANE